MYSKNVQYNLNELNINIDVTNKCNYNCYYCYAKNDVYKSDFNKVSLERHDVDTLVRAISMIDKYDVNIHIIGGEPTLFKHLNYFIDKLDNLDNVKNINILTNGSIDINLFKKSDKLIYTFTYHPTEIKNEIKFISNILKCKEYNVEFVMIKGHEQKVLNFINKYRKMLRKENINSTFLCTNFGNPILVKDGEDFSNVDIDLNGEILSSYYIINNKLNKFKNWKCYINTFRIDVYGNIRRFCTDLNSKNVPNVFNDINALKNITIEEFICDKEFCEMPCYLDFYKEYDANI